MDKVVHFEIPFDDGERATAFYKTVFGWKLNPVPEMKYTIAHTVDVDEKMMPKESGAINGGMMQRSEVAKTPVIVVNVEDINAALEKIKANGGKPLTEVLPVGDMGLYAYVKDTEGNVIGVWQNLMKK